MPSRMGPERSGKCDWKLNAWVGELGCFASALLYQLAQRSVVRWHCLCAALSIVVIFRDFCSTTNHKNKHGKGFYHPHNA